MTNRSRVPFCPLVRVLAALVLLALAGGCAKMPGPAGPVADVLRLPQSAAAYVAPATRDIPLIAPARSRALGEAFLREHFAPWSRTAPANGPDKVFAFFQQPDPGRYVDETLGHLSAARVRTMREYCDVDAYPNSGLHAVAVRGTSMRVLPTHRPAFLPFDLPGEGYPFDYLQNTALWAQTPLFVSHFSKDGAWALCESRFAYGWLPVQDIALVGEDFIRAFKTGEYLTFTQDRVPLADDFGLFRCQGRVGMVLPLIGREDGGLQALLAVRDDMGAARLRSTSVRAAHAAAFPLAPTPANFALLADALLGQPYGWGGMYAHRDCSALVMDIYAAFGLLLPRNSSQQAQCGDFVSLDGLADADKAAYIAQRARPWLTLLWKPGHIMLYLGLYHGDPVILHATWGLKTSHAGREGRHVIGAAVVTGLAPGLELPDLARPDGVLLHKLAGLAFPVPENPTSPAPSGAD